MNNLFGSLIEKTMALTTLNVISYLFKLNLIEFIIHLCSVAQITFDHSMKKFERTF